MKGKYKLKFNTFTGTVAWVQFARMEANRK